VPMSSTPAGRDQAFPDRPVRVIDPFGAAGGVDVIARALASRLAAVWDQPVIVETPPGAGSTAAPALVAQASPDGYTLLVNTSAQAYSAARAGELPYHPLRDFVPVAALTGQPYVLAAGAQSGITPSASSSPRPAAGPARSASPPPAPAPAPTSRWPRSTATWASPPCTRRPQPPTPSPM
jgi:tripartite-type tricarboxylate transporter receptor subunit TctC